MLVNSPPFQIMHSFLAPTVFVLSSILATTWAQDSDGILPFVWYFDTQQDFTISRCSTIDFNLQPNTAAGAPQVYPPYTALFYPVGSPPLVIPIPGDDRNTTRLRWRAALPTGTQMLFQFVDSKGQSGGVAPLYTIVDGTDCPSTLTTSSPITFTLDPPSNPSTCQTINVEVSGGVAPYVLSVVRASFTTINDTLTGTRGSWINSITGGGSMLIAVSDSTGTYSNTSPLIFSQGGSNTACLSNDTPDDVPGSRPTGHHWYKNSDGSPTGTIVGAVLGSIIGLLLIVLFALVLLYRRRLRQAREAGEPEPRGFEILRRPRRASDRSYTSTTKLNGYNSGVPPRYSENVAGIGAGAGYGPELDHMAERRNTDGSSVHSMQNIEPIRNFRITNPDNPEDDRSSDDGEYAHEVLRHGSQAQAPRQYGTKEERESDW